MGNFYYTTEQKEVEFIYSKASNTAYSKHNHISMFVLGIVLEGKLKLYLENSAVICATDDMIILMPYELHSIGVLDTSYSMLTLCLSYEFINSKPLLEIKKKLRQLGRRFTQENIITETHLKAFIDAAELIYEMSYSPKEAELTEQIKNRIILEPENELSLQEMADSIYISKYYFIRKFKEEVGLTPHNFQLQNRIRKAKHLIQEGHNIIDIAINCGFFDQSHFVKCFKKYVGMTPIEYEKSFTKL